MSLNGALMIASGGLANITRQMAVVSNNVANAATPDYAREVATQISATASGQGMGVFSGPVVREIDLQLQKEVFLQTATVSELQTRQTALQGIDSLQGTPGQGADLASILGKLEDSFTSLQADPSSSAAQSQVVSAAGMLAAKVNTLGNSYVAARQNAQENVTFGLARLNAAIDTVSSLTSKIVALKGQGASTADLENQRDTSLRTMSSLVKVSFINQADGGLIAATTGGLAITLKTPAPQLTMAQASASPQTYYPGGGIQPIMLNGADVTRSLNGGSIGAAIELRDKTMPGYLSQLDEFSHSLSTRFSSQGLQLFNIPTGGVSTVTPSPVQNGYIGYSTMIAVDRSVQTNPAAVRDGNVSVAGAAAGASAFTPNPANGPASFGGMISRVLSYSFGASIQLGVLQGAVNVAGLGPQGNLSAPFAAPQTLAGFATVLVAAQSLDTVHVAAKLDNEQAVQAALTVRVTSASGVSTDAELARMVGLQNAYGANARIISAAQAMWTQLLNAVP
jgi:flagellar hook-associated protein 1 FlgK